MNRSLQNCSYCSSETSSYTSENHDDEEIAMAIQAAEAAARNEARSRFKSSTDLIHRLFVCISGGFNLFSFLVIICCCCIFFGIGSERSYETLIRKGYCFSLRFLLLLRKFVLHAVSQNYEPDERLVCCKVVMQLGIQIT